MSKQKICQDSHEEIIYSGDECPLCIQREAMNVLLDGKEDLDQQNIHDLCHLSAILRGFIIELATLPSAFRGSVFSHTLARHHHFSYGGLFGLSAYLFSALRQFMLA
jgi:hypothetical protein